MKSRRTWFEITGLVTLTGVGGVGKTRLGIQVAVELVPDFDGGVWLVKLAPRETGGRSRRSGTILWIMPQLGRTMTDSIAEASAGRHLLTC